MLTWKAGCLVDKNLELLAPTLVDEGEPYPTLAPCCPLPQAARRQRIHRSSTKNIVLISVSDHNPGSGAFLAIGSGTGKKKSGSGSTAPAQNIVFISVADLDPGSGVFLTPGSGMGKKKSGSGMNNPDHISESLETIFWG